MSEEFDEDLFETRLEGLKDTQDGIQQMSSWCLAQRHHHKKIVSCWLNVFKRTRVEHRLVLYYLANDVVQYSKRKRYEFVESWATALQRATTMVRDEKVKHKVLRILKIWQQREIYSEDFLSDLRGLLNTNPPNKPPSQSDTSDEFQPAVLALKIRECDDANLAAERCLSRMPQAPESEVELLKQNLKDKTHAENAMKEIDRYMIYMKAYEKNLMDELNCRRAVLMQLDKAQKFYEEQQGEVRVVAKAYKNFGFRVKCVKKRLDDMTQSLPSPMPSPDVNAPSPERDADLQLPDEQPEFSASLFSGGNKNGYASYLDGNLPFDINDFKRDDSSPNRNNNNKSQPIEVIGSRSDDESYNSSTEYYKPEPLTPFSAASNIPIPGLNPMPVPPVQQQQQSYGALLPPPNPPLFGNNINSNNYGTPNNNYVNSMTSSNLQSHIPPPPMPPIALSGVSMGSGVSSAASNGSFNSAWNVNMSWPGLENSNVSSSSNASLYNSSLLDTPVSEPNNNDIVSGSEDIDHRQLHVSAFNTNSMSSKEKLRAVDVDHRNLISLTGSPVVNAVNNNSSNNQSWLSGPDKDYRKNVSKQNLKTIETTSSITSDNLMTTSSLSSIEIPPALPTGAILTVPSLSGLTKKISSPQKNNSLDGQKDDAVARYDPTDQVVDMDMSDEDLDDLYREYSGKQQNELENQQLGDLSDKKTDTIENSDEEHNRTPSLDSPIETLTSETSNNNWINNFDSPQPPSQQQQAWNDNGAAWNGSQFTGNSPQSQQHQRNPFSGFPPLPPPHLQTPPQQQHQYHPYGGRGGRNWIAPRGGAHFAGNHGGGNYGRPRGSPFRGGGGSYRGGKFRGGQNNSNWI